MKIQAILFLLIVSFKVYALDFTTNAVTGNWETGTNWVGGSAPSGGEQANITIIDGADITAASLNFTKQTNITVQSGAKLTISSVGIALDADKNFNITVIDGGTLIINGDFTSDKQTNIAITGNATFNGDVNLPANTVFEVNDPGIVDISGTFTGDFVSDDLTGTGTVIENGTVVLKIELDYFKAIPASSNVIISWQTATETNNEYFTIEKSTDGINFHAIKTIAGAGNSSTPISYTFTDIYPNFGVSYYRLKQTDYNGDFEIFDPVAVSFLSNTEFKVGPNPTTNYLQIASPTEMNGSFKLISQSGAVVYESELEGTHQTIDVSNIIRGNYLVVYATQAGIITKKIRLQ